MCYMCPLVAVKEEKRIDIDICFIYTMHFIFSKVLSALGQYHHPHFTDAGAEARG